MLETLISSKTRIKLLLKLFLNPGSTAYLRGMAEEFDESTNAVRIELNKFEESGMIVAEAIGNKKIYKANSKHPLYKDLHNIVIKYVGLDRIIDTIISQIGDIEKLFLTGDYALGKNTGVIDLMLVGNINSEYLMRLVSKAEELIDKKIKFLIYEPDEWVKSNQDISQKNSFLLWENKAR